MPENSTKYDPKAWKYVDVKAGSVTFAYAFRTNLDTTFGTLFGHKDVAAATPNLIVGANYPKPARASGKKAKKYGSSFIDSSQYAAAKADGFAIAAPRATPIAIGSAGGDSKSAKVTVAGLDYAWSCSDDTYLNLKDVLTELKITQVTTAAEAEKCIRGASFPKPARWKITLDDKTVSSFGDNDALITLSATILGATKTRNAITDPALYGLAAAGP